MLKLEQTGTPSYMLKLELHAHRYKGRAGSKWKVGAGNRFGMNPLIAPADPWLHGLQVAGRF